MVQPTPKHLSREQKEEIVESLKQRIEEKPVIGILDMHQLPSKQLQQIKKEMKEFADITMARKTLMEIAIDKSEREGADQLKENKAEQPAFIFSEKDPFQLYSLIKENKTSAAAQGGEEAPDDIMVPEGDTGMGPGSMSDIKAAGLDARVEEGSIYIPGPETVIEEGETISRDDAALLTQLGIEPLEIGLDLEIAFSEGEIFTAGELDIDTEQYRSDVENAAGTAFRVAVNAGIINETTVEAIISEAVQNAKNVSISEGIPTEETIEEILAHASSNAEGVNSKFDLDEVEIEETEEDEQEEPEEDEETQEEDETESSEQEDESEEAESEESSENDSEPDYEEIVSGTVDEVKESVNDLEEPDFEALIDAEESNKDRKTLIEWLENQG